MELRHSDVGRTSRQSNMGTVDDTAFVFIIRGAINVRSGAMSVQPSLSLRLDLEVQRMCCCVRFVRPPTCGCYRALYIVSVVRLSYVVHYVQTPETPLSFTDARSPLRYSTPGKKSHQSLAMSRLSRSSRAPPIEHAISGHSHNTGCYAGDSKITPLAPCTFSSSSVK